MAARVELSASIMNLWIVSFAKVQLSSTARISFKRFKTLFSLDNLCVLQRKFTLSSRKVPRRIDESIDRSSAASSRACAAAGNRKPVSSRFRSRSCLYKLTLVDLWRRGPRKVLENFSRVIEDADVYFDASASRLLECINGSDGLLECQAPRKLLKNIVTKMLHI